MRVRTVLFVGLFAAALLALPACGDSGGGTPTGPDTLQPGSDVHQGEDASASEDVPAAEDTCCGIPDVPLPPTDVPPPADVPVLPTDVPPGEDVPVPPTDVPAGLDTPPPLDAPLPDLAAGGWTVVRIQSDERSTGCSAVGTERQEATVRLDAVVVTAAVRDLAGTANAFHVADFDGREYKGVRVTLPKDATPGIDVGMVVAFDAAWDEVDCLTQLAADPTTFVQLRMPTPPGATDPEDVTLGEVGEYATIASNEAFEGVLVRVRSVNVANANPDGPDADHGSFVVGDDTGGQLWVSNDYGLPYMNAATDARRLGDQFDELVGVVEWVGGHYRLVPRTAADMVLRSVGGPDVVVGEDVPFVPADVPIPETVAPTAGLIITEIQVNPAGVSDAAGEWFELYNADDEDVDISGWTIEDQRGTAPDWHMIFGIDGPVVVPSHTYVVLGTNGDTAANGGVAVDYVYTFRAAGDPMGFALDDTRDEIILRNGSGEIVDRVLYDEAEWPFPFVEGHALALRTLGLDNALGTSWSAATQPYGAAGNWGTPGAANPAP